MLTKTWGKEKTHLLLVGMQSCTPLWKLVLWFLRKRGLDHQDPAITFLGKYTVDISNYHRDTCSIIFNVPLFIIVETWNLPRCMSTGEYIMKI